MKPNYDPIKHHRGSIRSKGYDYSKEGLYFITICTEEKRCLFGSVVSGKMQLNHYGKIVDDEWLNTINIRKDDVILHEYVVMPNHIHAIVEITRSRGVSHTPILSTSHTPMQSPSKTFIQSPSKTLGAIVRGFKGAVSKRIGKSIWQRNYYETIIRDDKAYANISNYIRNNPMKWKSL